MSARYLYKGLNIKHRFSAWIYQNFKDFDNKTDFTTVPGSTVVGNGAIKRIEDWNDE
ncbi:hypothetical protein HCY47_09060 [Limosilactobacillus fermentum]